MLLGTIIKYWCNALPESPLNETRFWKTDCDYVRSRMPMTTAGTGCTGVLVPQTACYLRSDSHDHPGGPARSGERVTALMWPSIVMNSPKPRSRRPIAVCVG